MNFFKWCAYFHKVTVVHGFGGADEVLNCNHSHKSYWAVLCYRIFYYAVQGVSNFIYCGLKPNVKTIAGWILMRAFWYRNNRLTKFCIQLTVNWLNENTIVLSTILPKIKKTILSVQSTPASKVYWEQTSCLRDLN